MSSRGVCVEGLGEVMMREEGKGLVGGWGRGRGD